jgi:hypothetical protein
MGEIGHLPIRSSGFKMANMWLATERLGGQKNSIEVWVGSASADPARGLVIRAADGDTVFKETTGRITPQEPLPIRGPGAHIESVKNKTGILTSARRRPDRPLRRSARKVRALAAHAHASQRASPTTDQTSKAARCVTPGCDISP